MVFGVDDRKPLEKVSDCHAGGANNSGRDTVEHSGGSSGSDFRGASSAGGVVASASWVGAWACDRAAAGVLASVLAGVTTVGESAGHDSWVAVLIGGANDSRDWFATRDTFGSSLTRLTRFTRLGDSRNSVTRLARDASSRDSSARSGRTRAGLARLSRLTGLTRLRTSGRGVLAAVVSGVSWDGGGRSFGSRARGLSGWDGLRDHVGGADDIADGLLDDAANIPGVHNLA